MPAPQTDTKNAATAAPGPAPAPSQGAGSGLDALEHEARSVEAHGAAIPPGAPGSVVQPGPSAADELYSSLAMARAMVAPMMAWWPDFGQVWGDGTLRGIAQAGADVMARHGLTVGQLMGQWGPYLMLVMAAAPPSFVTYQAIQQRKREEAQRPRQGTRQADGWHGPRAPDGSPATSGAADGSAG